MNTLEALMLGIVQGITEFLPVSSDGHLVLAETFFKLQASKYIFFDVILHVATLLAVCIYFRRRFAGLISAGLTWFSPGEAAKAELSDHKLVIAIIISTFVTGVIGLAMKSTVEYTRDSLFWVGLFFIITGCLTFSARFSRVPEPEAPILPMNLWVFAVLMGIAQALAVLPAISRSGNTLSLALLLGVSRSFAVEYSFIIMVPAVLGAAILELKEAEFLIGLGPALAGFCAAFVVGLACLWLLVQIVKAGIFHRFGYYTIPLGILVLWYSLK